MCVAQQVFQCFIFFKAKIQQPVLVKPSYDVEKSRASDKLSSVFEVKQTKTGHFVHAEKQANTRTHFASERNFK